MPYKKSIPSQVNRKFKVSFSTPTEDIDSLSTFLKYFSHDCAYNVIPGFQNTSLIDVESFLLQILPHTSNSILDITLPFIEITKKKNVIKHLARYIIVDRILIGIRVKISDNWSKSRTMKIPVSPNLQHFYDQNYITNNPQEIFVGQFILATQHFKLAPLFSSELSTLLEANSSSLLNDYFHLGCEVFSVINDLTEEKKKTQKEYFFILLSPFENFKNYRRDKTIFVCCGMHINVDLSEIYKTKSYAIQTVDRLKKIHVTQLDQTYTETFIIDMNLTKKQKKISAFDESRVINSDIETLDIKSTRIRHCYEKIDYHAIGRFEEPMQIQEEQNQLKIKENQLLMYFWNLYVKFNKRKSFILPLPMTKKDEILFSKLLELQQVTNIEKTELIKFIKLDPKAKLPKKYETFNFKSFTLERILSNEDEKLRIYFPLKQRVLLNSVDKDERFMEQVERKTINCLGCISEEIFKSLENESAPEKLQVLDQDQKFLEKFIMKKKNVSLELFYFEMAKYYPQAKLTAEFIEKMYESMKLIAIRQMTGTPFQAFVIQTSYEDVRHIFFESQQRFFARDGGIKNEEEHEGQQTQSAQNNFRSHIKKVIYHGFNQKKSTNSCHMCLCVFPKKFTPPYGRMCLGCNNYVCYGCFDKKTGQVAQSQQQFQQCLICQNKCDCDKCLKKRYKYQGISEFANPSKISLFRSSNNLMSSNENIRIEEEHAEPNESRKNETNGIKSEFVDRKTNNTQNFKIDPSLEDQKITIQRCWTCELHNRLERIIRFECSECKSEKCLDCQKAQNPRRNWVLRGRRLCNKCMSDEQEAYFKEMENKQLKTRLLELQNQLVRLKRNPVISYVSPTLQTNPFEDFAIVEENNQHESDSNHQLKVDKGGATPIFDRSSSGVKGNQSPLSFSERQSAEFASSQKSQMKNQDDTKKRKNSKSSGSGSDKSNQKSPPKKQIEQKKRKNSSGSQNSSIASFQKKPNKARSNSSKGSSKKSETKIQKRSRNSSAQSGEYQESSSENHNKKPEPKKDWGKNYHENTDKPNFGDRGGFRPRGDRGGSRGGNRNFDNNRQGGGEFKKWEKRDDGRDFRGRNDDRRGSNNRFNNDDRQGGFNNRFKNNNDDRQGGFNQRNNRNFDNNRGNYQDRNDRNSDNNNSFNNDDRNYNDSREEKKQESGLLFKSANTSSNNDEDMDY